MNFIFFGVHWGMTAVGRVQSEWTVVHTPINFGKIKFITYIYIIILAYLGENFTLQAALRAGGLYLDRLRAATSSQK